jgi:ABC-type maltose transport system permease subunit
MEGIKSQSRERVSGSRLLKDLGPKIMIYIILVISSVMIILPLLLMISSAFKNESEIFDYPIKLIPTHFYLDNFGKLMKSFPLYIYNSFKVTTRRRFADAKELGCNFLRLAHYPHSELAAQLADELGFLLWEEIPVYWAIDFENQATYHDAENQLLELIQRDQNRASVIIWSVGNENAATKLFTFCNSFILKNKMKKINLF